MNRNLLVSGVGTILHSLVVPIFALVFVIAYQPFGIYDTLQMEHSSFTFNATILFCIVLVSMTITRLWLYLIGRHSSIITVRVAVYGTDDKGIDSVL